MENELLQALDDVGYSGPLLDYTRFSQALQEGAYSPDYTSLVSWLTDQIGAFGNFDETVHPTSSGEDASSFLIELNTFLKEIGCVNQKLTTGNVNQRLATVEERGTLIDYLTAELMTFKILESKKPDDKNVQITIGESITAGNMREMLKALRFPKPPDNISAEVLFKKLYDKAVEVTNQVPKELIGKPLFFGELNKSQWEKLDALHGDLHEEYTIRREMLLTRLDVTVHSFSWSERIRPKEDELNKCYQIKRDAMKREPDVTIANLLAARDDLAIIEKTSNASVRKNTRSQINRVIIGAVPDRGGRPCEQEPPPPEMPPWQKDRVQGPPQRGGFGGGFGGGGRGGGEGGRGRGGGGRGGGPGGGGGYRDNKSASNNFGQNFEPNALKNFDTKLSGYASQGASYGNQGSGYSNQSSNYGNQSSGYNNQSSNYGNQGSNYNNQGGYERRGGGGDYNKGGHGGGRGGRVQGGWNQGGDSGSSNYNRGGYNNRNQGQGGGRRY